MRSRQRLIDLLTTANLDVACPRAEYRNIAADLLRGAIKALNGEAMDTTLFAATLGHNLKSLHLFATPHVRELLDETMSHLAAPTITVTPDANANAALTAENARLKEALRPFSINTRNIIRSFGELRAVSIVVENFNTDNTYPLCVGDLRRAAQEMEGK